jgi:hypothetical protein
MQNENLKGIIVANTFSRSWFEHFLDFERTRLEFAGKSFAEINQIVKLFSEFYGDYLLKAKTPDEVLQSKPHLKVSGTMSRVVNLAGQQLIIIKFKT